MKHLLKAAKECQHESLKDKMYFLMNVFLKNRKIGMSEAFYRILKTLHLQESDVKTVFIHTGFPENRSTWLKKIHSEDDGEAQVPANINHAYIVKSSHNENLYYSPPSWHDKYAARPTDIECLCLAQFVMWYYLVPRSWKKSDDSSDKSDQSDESDGVSIKCN